MKMKRNNQKNQKNQTYKNKKKFNKTNKTNKKTKKNKNTKKIKSKSKQNLKNNYYTYNSNSKLDNFKNLNCSPKAKTEKKSFTCFTDNQLHKMRDIWNARHRDQRINSNDSKEIWLKLKTYYSRMCNKESCWIKRIVKDTPAEKELESELLDSFAPESPDEWSKNPNEWLSSVDIMEVMKQYEKAYKCFEFLGPSPIDYDSHKLYGECVWEELCHFNLSEQIKNRKTKIGIIFNTHPHDKPGEHWISLFVNINTGKIFFFDSAGQPIPKQINKFVDNIKEQGLKLNPPIYFQFDQNYPTEHQYKNTECGVYSLFFIVHMLEDKITGNYLKTHVLKDEYMQKFRKIYFNGDL